jgi:hypothetical protein
MVIDDPMFGFMNDEMRGNFHVPEVLKQLRFQSNKGLVTMPAQILRTPAT